MPAQIRLGDWGHNCIPKSTSATGAITIYQIHLGDCTVGELKKFQLVVQVARPIELVKPCQSCQK